MALPVNYRDLAHSSSRHGNSYGRRSDEEINPESSPPKQTCQARDIHPGAYPTNHGSQASSSIPLSTLAMNAKYNVNFDSTPLMRDGLASDAEHFDNDGTNWRPFWLRQRALACFGTFFLCCTIALVVLLLLSNRPYGLGGTGVRIAEFWRFTPTAFLTIAAVLWGRVELQAMRYIPWEAAQDLQPGQDVDLSLDYLSMVVPEVLVQSLRRRHFVVFSSAVGSILLKVLVILSASLFKLQLLEVKELINVQVLDSFETQSNLTLVTSHPQAYYHGKAIQELDMDLPFGVSKNAAYQTYQPLNGPIDVPLRVVVDGLFADVECRPLQNYTISNNVTIDFATRIKTMRVDLHFKDCDNQGFAYMFYPDNVSRPNVTKGAWTLQAQPMNPCPSLSQKQPQFVYFGGLWAPSPQNASMLLLESAAGVICAPRAWVAKVEISDDGATRNVTVLPNQPQSDIKTDLSRLLFRILESSAGNWRPSYYPFNGPLQYDLEFWGRRYYMDDNKPDLSRFNTLAAHEAILNLTESLSPLLSHYMLRVHNESTTVGSAVREKTFLRVNEGSCIAMAVLFSLCTLIAIIASTKSRQGFKSWRRDPATILGSFCIFQTSDSARLGVRSGADLGNSQWAQSSNSPPARSSRLRAIFSIYALGLIIALAVTLKISKISDGLATISKGSVSFWWTSLPAFAFFWVVLYSTTSDFEVRSLATLSTLATRSCSARELDISFLDMVGVKALYYSLQFRVFSVSMVQVVAIACGFLLTLSTLLFTTKNIPERSSVQLRQGSWFGPTTVADEMNKRQANRGLVSSLLMIQGNSSMTYPHSTFEDLVFPTLQTEGLGVESGAEISIGLTLPSAKLNPTCTNITEGHVIITHSFFNQTRPSVTLHFNQTEFKNTMNLNYYFPISPGALHPGTHSTQLPVDRFYFAELLPSPWSSSLSPADREIQSFQSYIWGSFSTSKMEIEHVSIWRCNYTWVEVPTAAKLITQNGDLRIDYSEPPSPDYTKIRPLDSPFPIPLFAYGDWDKRNGTVDILPPILTNTTEPLQAPPQFRVLMKPYGPLIFEDFGNPDRDTNILQRLQYNHAFAASQLVNLEHRWLIDGNISALPTRYATPLSVLDATKTLADRSRLIQSEGITIAMILVIFVAFIVNAWALASTGLRAVIGKQSLLLNLDLKGLVPNKFNSIKMMQELVEVSNYRDVMPENAYQIDPKELHQNLGAVRFRLGWFFRKDMQEKVLTIGTLGDEDCVFLGPK